MSRLVSFNGLALAPVDYQELDFLAAALDARILFTRSTTKTYFGSDGLMKVAAVNECPLEYDPLTLLPRGRSFWGQRTNLLIDSQAINNWTNNGGLAVTTDAMVAPDGTATADTVAATVGTRYRTATAATATIYTYSIFVKPTDPTKTTRLYCDGAALASSASVTFTPSTGATANLTGASAAYITNIGNGWYRLAIVLNATTSAGTLACHVSQLNADVHGWWGAQLEASEFATPYIPTTTAAVTRSADAASITDLSKVRFNLANGSFYVEYMHQGADSTVNSTNRTALSLSDGTSNNRYLIYNASSGSRFIVITGAVTQALMGSVGIVWGVNQVVKHASRFGTDNFIAAVNGVLAASDLAGTPPVVNALTIGATNSSGGGVLCGVVRKVRIYPRMLSDAELQAITA